MARIKIKNLSKIKIVIRKKITKALRTKEMRKGVGKTVVDEIRKISYGSPSDGYLAWRKRNASLNTTHEKYTLNNINITLTGALLKDLEKNVVMDSTGGKAEYVLEHSDKMHKPYKTKTGKTKPAKFSDISKGVSKYYDYLKFTKDTKAKLLKYIKKNLYRLVK